MRQIGSVLVVFQRLSHRLSLMKTVSKYTNKRLHSKVNLLLFEIEETTRMLKKDVTIIDTLYYRIVDKFETVKSIYLHTVHKDLLQLYSIIVRDPPEIYKKYIRNKHDVFEKMLFQKKIMKKFTTFGIIDKDTFYYRDIKDRWGRINYYISTNSIDKSREALDQIDSHMKQAISTIASEI